MIYVAVGSNLQPHVHVPRAIERMEVQFGPLRCSPFYETAPIGRPEQPNYWNGVVMLACDLPRGTIEARLRAIEEAEGRVRTSDKWAARTLDLDIIGMGGVWDPEVEQRPFLRRCLADLGVMDPPADTWPRVWSQD